MTAPTLTAAESWQLVERAQAGDTDAFAQLYAMYRLNVFRLVYYRVGKVHIAEDITADAWAKALKNVGRVEWQGKDFGAWLSVIARNAVTDYFKSGRYRLEHLSPDLLDPALVHRPALADSAEDEAVLSEVQRVLRAAVGQLNPEQQECIVLRFLRGLSVAETAQAMGKNEGAVKALQYRACRALGRFPQVAALGASWAL